MTPRAFGTLVLLALGLSILGCAQGQSVDKGTGDTPVIDDPAPLVTYCHLRLMTANLSSGNNQDYDGLEGIRIMEGCAPDVAMVQEFAYKSNSVTDYQEMANLVIYKTASPIKNAYYWQEGGHSIPNGIISKYPILDGGEWDDTYLSDRDFAWARIDIPGESELWAVSIHIKASSGTDDKIKRASEAALLRDYITAHVPPSAYLVVGGDYNTYSNDSSVEPCLSYLDDFLVLSGAYPADLDGDTDTNSGRSSPYDRILADVDLEALKATTVIGANSFADGFIADTRIYTPINDLAPALATDSAAKNMQHMGVVRDFLIPLSRRSSRTRSDASSTRPSRACPAKGWRRSPCSA
jgi:endonuclease/exonuclease/phosphatase family metal-dependent hydrolase